jgi:hypothetical protein
MPITSTGSSKCESSEAGRVREKAASRTIEKRFDDEAVEMDG